MSRAGIVVSLLVGVAVVACMFVTGILSLPSFRARHSAAAISGRAAHTLRSAVGGPITGQAAVAAEGSPTAAVPAIRRGTMTIYHNIAYGTEGNETLLLDAYIPDGGPHPAVVVIHGGGWAHGDKYELTFEGEDLAAAGFAAFVVDYRMAPPGGDWHAPIPLNDVRTAVVWVRDHAADYRVNPDEVAALGNSAGGNLAMMLGTTGTPGVDRVEAVVSLSGQSDLPILSTEHTIHAATNYIGCTSAACPSIWIANSPIHHCDHETVPMLLVNSTHELMPLNQATLMAAKLTELGIPHELRVVDGNRHASEIAGEVWPQTLAFLRHYLGGQQIGQAVRS